MEHQMIFKGTHCRIRFPQMREILVFSLQDLADKTQQEKRWVNWEKAGESCRFYSNLKAPIDVIYNDLDLDENAESKLGYVLVDKLEVESLKPLITALDNIYDIIGPWKPDAAYIDSPLWDKVVEAASNAFKVFMANEEEAKKTNPHPWQGEEDWGPDPEAITEK